MPRSRPDEILDVIEELNYSAVSTPGVDRERELPPEIILTWEGAMRGAPWEYIEKCEAALTEYESR